MNHPIPVVLTDSDRTSLQTFMHAGKATARTFPQARILFKAADGWTDQQICAAFDINRNISIRVRQLYLQGEHEAVLHDKQQQHHRQTLTGGQAAHLCYCVQSSCIHMHVLLRISSHQTPLDQFNEEQIHHCHPCQEEEVEKRQWREAERTR